MPNRNERIASVVLIVLAAGYLLYAFNIPMPVIKQQLGPDAFPKAIGFLMLALSIAYAYQQFTGKVKEDEVRAAIIGAEEKLEDKPEYRHMVVIFILMLAYAVLFEKLGYAVTTFVIFMAGVVYLDRRHLVRDTIIGLCASFGLYFVFTEFLRVQLPAGILRSFGF